MSDNLKMREEFEKWAQTQGLDITDRSGLAMFYMNLHTFIAWNAWKAAQSEQSAELERLRKDAARYLWLRTKVNVDRFGVNLPCGIARYEPDVTDEAIDAAIAATKEKK